MVPQVDDDGSAPDVWLQLLEHCASIRSCQPAVVRELGLQLVEQQQTVAVLKQQVSQLQHQALEAVELRGRMASIEGQLRQLVQAQQQK